MASIKATAIGQNLQRLFDGESVAGLTEAELPPLNGSARYEGARGIHGATWRRMTPRGRTAHRGP